MDKYIKYALFILLFAAVGTALHICEQKAVFNTADADKLYTRADELRGGEKAKREISLDINTASEEDISQLEGIGEKLAEEIVRYRHDNGPFKSTDELKNIPGIGEKKFENISGNIYIK